jgi:hypothetical protein
MIDSLKPNITDDGHTDELSNINSPSSYIVDLTDDESSEELKVNTFTRDQ